MENKTNTNASYEAIKNKYVQESPGLFNSSTLPSTYGKAYLSTPQYTEAPDIVIDDEEKQENTTPTDDLGVPVFGAIGALTGNAMLTGLGVAIDRNVAGLGSAVKRGIHSLHEAIQKERLETKLGTQQGYLKSEEAKWLPQLQEAEEYYKALSLLENVSNQILTDEEKAAVETINRLRPAIMEYAKTNPYLQNIVYDTSISNKYSQKGAEMQLKTWANEFRNLNLFDVNPLNNVSTAISQGVFNTDELELLAAGNDKKLTTAKKLQMLEKNLSEAQKNYDDKTADIKATKQVLQKGNWLYDPKYLTKEEQEKFQNTELSITDPSSWFYNLSHLGSSFSEGEMMLMQMGTSFAAQQAAKTALVKGALGLIPPARLALALTETGINLWLSMYYRHSETSAEVFDNYNQAVMEGVEKNEIDIEKVAQDYIPKLQKLGYDTNGWTPDEILETAFAQGLRSNDMKFNQILDLSEVGLEQVRATNNALSYVDYLEALPFSYGGKMLWDATAKAIGKPFAKTGTHLIGQEAQRILTPSEQITEGFYNLLKKRVGKIAEEVTADEAKRIVKKQMLYKGLAGFAGKNIATAYAEGMEEGIQEAVGQAYRAGVYDKYGKSTPSAYEGFTNMLECGLDAQLAYLGLSNKNYLNTDEQLRNAMNVGSFISMAMPFTSIGGVRDLRRISRQQKVADIIDTYAARSEANGEADVKMDALLSAMRAGKDLSYITNYLEGLKEYKQTGVTDEMIDADSRMATDLYSIYESSVTKDFLKNLGLSKDSQERGKIAKLAVHLQHRIEDQLNAVSAIDEALEQKDKEFSNTDDAAFEAYIDALLEKDTEYKKLKAYPHAEDALNLWEDEDIQENPEGYNIALQQAEENRRKVKYRNNRKALVRELIRKLAVLTAINSAVTETNARLKQLQEIADETGQPIDLSGINSISTYLTKLGEDYNNEVSEFYKKYEIKLEGELYKGPHFEGLVNLFKSRAIANAALTNIKSQYNAILRGKLTRLAANDVLDKSKIKNKDIFELLKKDQADKEKQEKRLALEYVRQLLQFVEGQEQTARQEKVDDGDMIDDQTTPSDRNDNEPPTTPPAPAAPTEDTTQETPAATEENAQQPIPPADQAPGRGNTVDEIIANEKAAEEAKHAESQLIDEAEASQSAGVSPQQSKEVDEARSKEEATPAEDDLESEKAAARAKYDNVEEADPEQLEVKDNQNKQPVEPTVPQPVENQESTVEEGVEETQQAEEGVDEQTEEEPTTQEEPAEQKPTDAITPNNNLLPGQHDVRLTDNGLFVDGNFVDNELIERCLILDAELGIMETLGESFYLGQHPDRASSNNDAVSNNKQQKVRHIANTFFYRPDTDESMTPTANGKPLIFRNSNGDVLPILPGSVLAKRLLKNGWLATTKKYYVVGTSDIGGKARPTAIYLAIEDKDGVMLTALRDENYINSELSKTDYTEAQKQLLQNQIAQLRALRQAIVQAYTEGNENNVPNEVRKTVTPKEVRISNGTFDNQKDESNAPVRRKLTLVKALHVKSDVKSVNEALKSGELEIGYGTGNTVEFIAEPQVIRKLGSETELTDTQGRSRSGCLYLIPKANQTPSGSVAPILLSIAKLGSEVTGELRYTSGNTVSSLPELVFKLLTKKLVAFNNQQITEDLLNLIVNQGNKTLVSREVAQKYPFLAGKMLYYNDTQSTPHLQFGYHNYDGTYTLVEINPNAASQDLLNRTLNQFASNLHWNTDKNALLQPIPESIRNLAKAYFDANPKKKSFSIYGLKELTFTKEDLGLDGSEPVSLLAWMINTGKVQTDLGDNLYKAPFVYANGISYQESPKQVKETKEKVEDKTKAEPEIKEKPSLTVGNEPESPKTTLEVLTSDQAKDYIAEYNKKTGKNIKFNPRMTYMIGKNGMPIPQLGKKGGLASQERGTGKISVESAKNWLYKTLGIEPTDVIVTEAVMRMANAPLVFGAFQVCLDRLNGVFAPKIYLSEQAGEGVEFHEAFHYVSQLILSDSQRAAIYQELARSNKKYADMSAEEAEEALAEQFRAYMLNEQKGGFRYKIKKFFKALYNIVTLNRKGLLKDALFKLIRNGAFKNYKPTQDTLQLFNLRFGDGLYYYIPGHTQEELAAIPSITDSSTFYKVVDSLNSVVMGYFNINSLEDLKNLPLSINDIFDVILQGNLDSGLFDGNTSVLIRDIIKNKEVFKKEIENYLRNFSIVKHTTEEQEEQRSEEDKPDNTWDKESFTISKKENVALHAKLFFYSIPKLIDKFNDKTGLKEYHTATDQLLGMPITEDFDVVYNKVLENLWDVESYLDLVNRCKEYAKFDNFFEAMYEKLTSLDNPLTEQQLTEILNTIKSAKNGLATIMVSKNVAVKKSVAFDELLQEIATNTEEFVKSYDWEVADSDVFRKIARLPGQWSSRFFLSNLVTTENNKRIINQKAFTALVYSKHLQLQLLFRKKNANEGDYEQASKTFIDICNALGISMDLLSLQYLLQNNYGDVNFNTLKKFYQGVNKTTSQKFSLIIQSLKNASDNKISAFTTKAGATARTFDRIFTSGDVHSQINEMAVAWGKTHPTPEEFSVIGADGNLVFPITENNYMSDQIRWLKNNANGKRELLKKNAYSSSSLIVKSCETQPETVKLNTYLNLKEDLQNTNRDYFGISPVEDYISKMVFGFANHLFCPTMSDKKTWHTISGLKMMFNGELHNLAIKEFIPSTKAGTEFKGEESVTVYRPIKRRFSNRTLSIFKGYMQDELNAVKQYYSVRLKVEDNPNLQVNNYFGTKGGNYADGNGGRFRYFGIWDNGAETYNFNESLAKAEYAKDWDAIKTILDTAQNILNDTAVADEVVNNMLLSFANNEIQNAITLGIITPSLLNKLIPDNILHSKKTKSKDLSEDKQSIEDTVTDKAVENYELDLVYSAIACHALNTAMSVIEIEKCFTGDPALYKWSKSLVIYKEGDKDFRPRITNEKSLKDYLEKYAKDESAEERSKYGAYYMINERAIDKIKRLSSVLSTGTNLRTKFGDTVEMENQTDSKFQVLLLKDYEVGSSVYDQLYDLFYTSIAKDVLQKEFNLTDTDALNWVKPESIKASLGRLKKQNPKAYESIAAKAKVSAKPYSKGEINVADAAVYIRPEFYQRLMRSLGLWNEEVAEAYRIMENESDWLHDADKYAKAMKAVTQPLKMVYFGDHYDNSLGLNVNTFDKMALFPLFKTFAKADNKALYDRMNDTSKGVIDMVAFESAIKVGARARLSYYSDGKVNDQLDQNSDIDGKTGNGLATYTQDLNQIRLQLNTDPHEHLERAFGTQAIKIGFANVIDEREYGANKGLSVKGKQIKQDIMDCIDNLSKIGKAKLRKQFFTNGRIDNNKVVSYLQKQAENSGMSQEIISQLTVDENGNINVNIEAQSVRDWVESKIVSFVNKLIVDVNTPGGSAIQMSSFAYEAVNRNVTTDPDLVNAFNEGKKLNFLAKEGHMQVLLSENFFRDILPENIKSAAFATKRQWLIDHGIIGSKDGVEAKPYGIGYRIPTQGLSSMFSFQVADIMPANIGDTIVVPEEFTAMTGSDKRIV